MNETSNQLLPLPLSRSDSSGTLSSVIRTPVEGVGEGEGEEERGRGGGRRRGRREGELVKLELGHGSVSPHQLTVVPLPACPQEGPPSEDQPHLLHRQQQQFTLKLVYSAGSDSLAPSLHVLEQQ